MKTWTVGVGMLIAWAGVAAAQAQEDDVIAGEKLFVAQCQLCHGSAAAPQASRRPAVAQSAAIRLAMRGGDAQTVTDFSRLALPVLQPHNGSAGERIAFAPPFGPNLHGVYGRPAGSVVGFDYSSAFLNALKGMEWNEAALNVWLMGTQAWVPGVYMFYKQPDAEIRRKIIAYLKANS